jgi:hypothetical protein
MITEIMLAIAITSLLLCANMSAANEDLVLSSPGDYQVVQRQTAAAGAFYIAMIVLAVNTLLFAGRLVRFFSIRRAMLRLTHTCQSPRDSTIIVQ